MELEIILDEGGPTDWWTICDICNSNQLRHLSLLRIWLQTCLWLCWNSLETLLEFDTYAHFEIPFRSFFNGLICIIIHYSQRLVQYSWGIACHVTYLMLLTLMRSHPCPLDQQTIWFKRKQIQQTHSYQPVFAVLKGQWFIFLGWCGGCDHLSPHPWIQTQFSQIVLYHMSIGSSTVKGNRWHSHSFGTHTNLVRSELL